MAYANCAAAYKAGRAELVNGVDPDYFSAGDADRDGIACELANAPAGFVAKPYASPPSSTASPSASPSLPVTGPPAGGVIALALALLLLGVAVVSVASKRYRGAHR